MGYRDAAKSSWAVDKNTTNSTRKPGSHNIAVRRTCASSSLEVLSSGWWKGTQKLPLFWKKLFLCSTLTARFTFDDGSTQLFSAGCHSSMHTDDKRGGNNNSRRKLTREQAHYAATATCYLCRGPPRLPAQSSVIGPVERERRDCTYRLCLQLATVPRPSFIVQGHLMTS